MVEYALIAFLGALGGALLFTPVSIRLARRHGVLDAPEGRKVHVVPTPRWGGMGIFTGVFLAVALLSLFSPGFRALLGFSQKIVENGEVVGVLGIGRQLTGILIGAAIVWFLGAADDRRSLPPLVKLFAQVIAAYVAMMYGVRMEGIALPGYGFVSLPLGLSQALTLLWLLAFMNMMNLADGLDGLAAGLGTISAGAFVIVCWVQGETDVAFYANQLTLASTLSAAVCGAALGFLFYNFPPAVTFMGDGGSLVMGFLLGAVSLIGTLKTSAVLSLIIPLMVVALPATDTAYAVFRRVRRGQGLMAADRGHFHHRLLDNGWTPREVTLLAYVLTLLLALGAILLTVFKGKV